MFGSSDDSNERRTCTMKCKSLTIVLAALFALLLAASMTVAQDPDLEEKPEVAHLQEELSVSDDDAGIDGAGIVAVDEVEVVVLLDPFQQLVWPDGHEGVPAHVGGL